MDFEEAQAAFLTAEKKFRHLSERPTWLATRRSTADGGARWRSFTSATRSCGSCSWGNTGAYAPT
jgi:hypothetical protein